METSFYFEWEMELIKWFQSFESGFFNVFSKAAAMLGEEYFLFLVLGIFYWSIHKNTGRRISLTLMGGMMFGTLIKCVFLRIRPYMINSEIKCIRAAHPDEDAMSISAQGYSFPSLHSSMAVSGYSTIAVSVKKRIFTVLAVVIPLIIGITRVYLGVHFPTDVLAGWGIGIIATVLFLAIENKWGYKAAFISLLAAGFPGFFYCCENDFFACYGLVLGLLLGFVFEEKKVNFAMPKKITQKILRPIIGILLFVVISIILKLPIANIESDGHETFLFYYRMFRYCLSAFVISGIYPMAFKWKILK